MLEQEDLENNFQPVKIDLKEYSLAMEHIQNLYDRLCSQKKLHEDCKECPLLAAVTALKEFAATEEVKAVEKNLGFNLPQ